MKKLIFILLCSMLLGAVPAPTSNLPAEQNPTYVYICTGSSSVAYHSHPNCKGLRNCKASVKKVTMAEAERMNRRPCKICCE